MNASDAVYYRNKYIMFSFLRGLIEAALLLYITSAAQNIVNKTIPSFTTVINVKISDLMFIITNVNYIYPKVFAKYYAKVK